ncbi:hypothetical protein [Corynebacterium pacaense]|uniref:hypothetical protein n=1 Tax=Corynebacterium pacaense TaxID=1816684 RepID=UPI0009BC6221|nr:hypothetical protein [Corynebacterium pacaense]
MKTRLPAALLLLTATVLSACSPPSQQDSTAPETSEVLTTSATASALGPIIVPADDLAEVSAVSISLDRPLSITAGAETTETATTTDAATATESADWTATISDPSVAEFVAGGVRNGARFNPGIKALKAGTSEVTLVGPDGVAHTLTLKVVTDNAATGIDR